MLDVNFTMVEDIFPRGYDKERVANGHLTDQVCQVHLTTIQHSGFQYTGDNLFFFINWRSLVKKTQQKHTTALCTKHSYRHHLYISALFTYHTGAPLRTYKTICISVHVHLSSTTEHLSKIYTIYMLITASEWVTHMDTLYIRSKSISQQIVGSLSCIRSISFNQASSGIFMAWGRHWGRGIKGRRVTSGESNRIRGSSTSRELSAKPIGRDSIAGILLYCRHCSGLPFSYHYQGSIAEHCLKLGCIGLYNVHLLRPQDFHQPSKCPLGFSLRHLSGQAKSWGRRGCTTQYIPTRGSVQPFSHH